jgi:hypothetical protein
MQLKRKDDIEANTFIYFKTKPITAKWTTWGKEIWLGGSV